jgi:hypothetical protein
VLEALIAGVDTQTLLMPGSTRSYAEEDLEALGLQNVGVLSSDARDWLTQAGFTLAPAAQWRFRNAP